jgi:bacteriophage N4 adsorption protein B
VDGIFVSIEFWQRELLLFSAFWFLIGTLDDIIVDIIWGVRWFYRKKVYYNNTPPLRVDQLPAPLASGMLAVFIATWKEADVIGAMLCQAHDKWQNGQTAYRIYVGCYPNDYVGISAIIKAARADPHIRLVLCAHPGPTTKADCLNRLWKALVSDELAEGGRIKAIVLHDAEDMVHRDELKIYDRLIEKNQIVQLPVIPVRVAGSAWISGHYLDEFAEAHGKSLVVREAIGAALPLAGVGCAIDRNILGQIALANHHQPFDTHNLTEDYELGLRIGALGGRSILARICDTNGELVATRACFPDTIESAVKQKARWITGIALTGWDRIGWHGGIAGYWMLLRDRRAVFSAIVLSIAYICIIMTGILKGAEFIGIHYVRPFPPFLVFLLWVTAFLLVYRLLVRAAFVMYLYGFSEALISIPRSFIANIISIMAARRACWNYIRHCFGRSLIWDKTVHSHFPG